MTYLPTLTRISAKERRRCCSDNVVSLRRMTAADLLGFFWVGEGRKECVETRNGREGRIRGAKIGEENNLRRVRWRSAIFPTVSS